MSRHVPGGHAVRDTLLVTVGTAVAGWQLLTGSVTLLLVGLGLVGAPAVLRTVPVLRPDPRVAPRKSGCLCRGCRHPGQRRLYERLLGKPLSNVPRSHAQALLGVTHGRIHDARRLEAEAGVQHTAEVIAHFALLPDQWVETSYSRWTDFDAVRRGGCGANPDMIAIELR